MVRQGVQDVQGAVRKESIEEGTAANGKGCSCDQSAACRAPPAQRAWVAFISPCLLLFAMCIHGIFEGLALGIQVRLQDSTLPDALVPHMGAACLESGISEAHRTEKSASGWYYISPCLPLFAACTHGIFEVLTLGIQVGALPEFGEWGTVFCVYILR